MVEVIVVMMVVIMEVVATPQRLQQCRLPLPLLGTPLPTPGGSSGGGGRGW